MSNKIKKIEEKKDIIEELFNEYFINAKESEKNFSKLRQKQDEKRNEYKKLDKEYIENIKFKETIDYMIELDKEYHLEELKRIDNILNEDIYNYNYFDTFLYTKHNLYLENKHLNENLKNEYIEFFKNNIFDIYEIITFLLENIEYIYSLDFLNKMKRIINSIENLYETFYNEIIENIIKNKEIIQLRIHEIYNFKNFNLYDININYNKDNRLKRKQ